MLNYLWAGMIVLSIVAALFQDISDEINQTYQNNKTYSLPYHKSNDTDVGVIKLADNTTYFFELNSNKPQSIIVNKSEKLPKSWQKVIEKQSSANKQEVLIEIVNIDKSRHKVAVKLPQVHWVKIREITTAAFDMAEFAIKLALGLVGLMALWLGLMRVAEKSGLINYLVKFMYPLLYWLFPKIDKNEPVLGSIGLNMTANILGLGNAATPMGIKAMQQLQILNKKKDTASDEMCMFLAINTSSVQLLPPVTLIAVMGAGVSELIIPIILATTASTLAAIFSAKLFAKMRAA